MTFKELKKKIKEEQKTLAQSITNGKTGRKPKNRNDKNYKDWDNLAWNGHEYRHKHIIYCQFFNNTPYASIEQPRDGNKPSSYMLDSIKTEWEGMLDEALRDCA
jgi:hypothetical protein